MAYATIDELELWLGTTPPAGAERLLERASELVAAHVRRPVSVGPLGVPTDAADTVALRAATTAQVEMWLIDGEAKGITGGCSDEECHASELAPRARDVLRLNGWLNPAVAT